MSALPPTADIADVMRDVRFVPKADIGNIRWACRVPGRFRLSVAPQNLLAFDRRQAPRDAGPSFRPLRIMLGMSASLRRLRIGTGGSSRWHGRASMLFV